MSHAHPLDELSQRLARSSTLSAREAEHLIDEVLAFLDESLEQFVRRRHRELQRAGLANAGIYPQLVSEVAARRFRQPDLTARQIRRLVYG